mmetsp:Transcript_55748/g.156445  ORF Transcript_55748/g.156445 Transcript_55748/m.156445 type:complete len:105 (+) Transcript_55748:320-634(+)
MILINVVRPAVPQNLLLSLPLLIQVIFKASVSMDRHEIVTDCFQELSNWVLHALRLASHGQARRRLLHISRKRGLECCRRGKKSKQERRPHGAVRTGWILKKRF